MMLSNQQYQNIHIRQVFFWMNINLIMGNKAFCPEGRTSEGKLRGKKINKKSVEDMMVWRAKSTTIQYINNCSHKCFFM